MRLKPSQFRRHRWLDRSAAPTKGDRSPRPGGGSNRVVWSSTAESDPNSSAPGSRSLGSRSSRGKNSDAFIASLASEISRADKGLLPHRSHQLFISRFFASRQHSRRWPNLTTNHLQRIVKDLVQIQLNGFERMDEPINPIADNLTKFDWVMQSSLHYPDAIDRGVTEIDHATASPVNSIGLVGGRSGVDDRWGSLLLGG